jgi:hypothetical protein
MTELMNANVVLPDLVLRLYQDLLTPLSEAVLISVRELMRETHTMLLIKRDMMFL